MEVESTSYLETVVKEATDGDGRAEQALALAADAVRLHVATATILGGLLSLCRQHNPLFAEVLDREIAAIHTRIDSISKTLNELGRK